MGEVDQADQDRKVLEALVVNNPDLERLEALLDRFNIFEAVGLVRQEIRHSTFLAFLLDPRESHGLGDAFAKRLLQEAIMSTPDASAPVTPIELSLWDLGEMEVRREWRHIDIFLLDERNRLAVIIENKIDTIEHSDQLQRYHETVKQHYSGYRVIGLYLTPDGDEPSHDNYLPLNYGLVCEVLDSLVQSRASVSNIDLQVLVTHYTQMLRRHIVGDSEIARLCRQIYQKHQQALDLIYEHRPDRQTDMREFLDQLISERPDLATDDSTKNYIYFIPYAWDRETLRADEKYVGQWTKTRRILLFQFFNFVDKIDVKLAIGPGPEEVRQKLLDMALKEGTPFNPRNKTLNRKWNIIFSRALIRLKPESFEEDGEEAIKQEISERWQKFLTEDLPRIDAVLKKQSWIWQ